MPYLLLLAPAPSLSALPDPDPIIEAQRVIARASPEQELVDFHNVRVVSGVVCGQLRRPRARGLSQQYTFAFVDEDTWAERTAAGYFGQIEGVGGGNSESSNDAIGRHYRKGQLARAVSVQRRLAIFERAAAELLRSCG